MENISLGRIKEKFIPVCSPAKQTEVIYVLEECLSQTDTPVAKVNTTFAHTGNRTQAHQPRTFSSHFVPQSPANEAAASFFPAFT